MKTRYVTSNTVFLIVVFTFFSLVAMAQPSDPGFPFGEDPGDPAGVPIDHWIIPMLFLAVGLWFYYAKKYNYFQK
jgi:hypothetical protein